MIKVSCSYLTRLLGSTHSEVTGDIYTEAKADAKVSSTFPHVLEQLGNAVNYENEVLYRPLGSPLTPQLQGLDRQRDGQFIIVRTTVEQMRYAVDQAQRDAAEAVWKRMERYKIRTNAQYDAETGALTNFCEDMLANWQSELELMNLKEAVEALQQSNDEFCRLMRERDQEDSTKRTNLTLAARAATDTWVKNLFMAVNGAIVEEGEDPYANFCGYVNALFQRIMQQALHMRSTDVAEGEEEDSELEEEEEEEQEEETTPTLYPLVFMHNGSVFESQEYEEGATVLPPTAPSGYKWQNVPATMPAREVTVYSERISGGSVPGGGGGSGFE